MSLKTNIKILLVEDAAVMRKMEIKVLKQLGIEQIVQAEDGNDAIEKLTNEEGFNLIISDWNMPNMNGFELLKWVKESEKFKSLPFLMATGRGEKKEIASAVEAGANSFISKPFNADELKTKIEEAIGEKKKDKVATIRPRARINEFGKVIIKLAHIQITDHLVLGVLKHLINTGEYKPKHFELETECMSSWNPVGASLEQGTVEGACVLAPIAMDLYNYNVPIKLVLFAHKNGSMFVRNKKGGDFFTEKENFFKHKSFYIPHTLSVHNMLAHLFFSKIGLKPGVSGQEGVDISFEVAPPIKMTEFLADNSDAAGYLVAEPLGTKAIAGGIADMQFASSELWNNHPCCVITLQQDLIDNHTEAVFELTDLLVKAGKYINDRPETAAKIGVDFLDPDKTLGLKVPLLKNVLTEPLGIKTHDLYPVLEDLEKMQHYMHDTMNVGNIIDVKQFVDLRFAQVACKGQNYGSQSSKLFDSASEIENLLERKGLSKKEISSKSSLNLEGKYLTFILNKQTFGIDILKIKEIIRMVGVTAVPNASASVLGMIDLRGKLIPIIDPKMNFNMPKSEYTDKNIIIVLEAELDGRFVNLGIVVDAVSKVTNIAASEIVDPPSHVKTDKTNYMLAFAKMDDGLAILVNIDKLVVNNKFVLNAPRS
ncbi:MAG: chemotaxis protein CheW [Bacteroidetes bacterium]|nr:chemotaxis protein CheW [Bacteroidota bacterium]MBU1114273.1 chemotaxis protein CheW [Bacteroidota bacterium]MBU1797663.1 chemotaxis protein CheW [Bacteroidota bacterium]